jgi:hypothetical protein
MGRSNKLFDSQSGRGGFSPAPRSKLFPGGLDMRLILVASLCLAAAACSPSDQQRVSADTRAAGHDVADATRDAAHNIQNDPTVRQAGADARQAAHDTAVAVRKGAADAEIKSGQALTDAGAKAKAQANADSSGQSKD